MPRSQLLPIVLFAALLTASCSTPGRSTTANSHAGAGVEILGVQLLAGDDLARLNYRVLDYDEARRSMGQAIRLFPASDVASAPLAVADIGTLGPIQQRPSRADRIQFILFANRGRALRRGTTAVVAIGDTRITGIPVS